MLVTSIKITIITVIANRHKLISNGIAKYDLQLLLLCGHLNFPIYINQPEAEIRFTNKTLPQPVRSNITIIT